MPTPISVLAETRISADVESRILTMAAEGRYLRDIFKSLEMGPNTFCRYLARHPNFEAEFARARRAGREQIAEYIGRLVDEESHLFNDQMLRLKADNLKWMLKVQDPAVYGDRQTVTVESVDLGSALSEAKARAAKIINVTPAQLNGPDPFE